MKERDTLNTELQTIQSVISQNALPHNQLPADYNAMDWDEFFAIFRQRQPALYHKFITR